ncbi:hypothetical protein PTSG_02629 [Salpingoeca rosetta]|uniref:Uncharacterized protein n=1 Tax=Salpingoeca rosetta (strain ATCC 50818 / BSB-021) TaxID=946362 RepID=F2U2V0_SALR5|nr:uncharacterized protein PTSG_02629 [Salpingoeca rosetta]EGD81944.1 hypothetical protein PTSG_02629 [Salpingoeca rosetta]|eukprot:XP_004996127.1 hypothetical protein PTSG_02629 [Salpingoeca rosetta]
MGSADEEVIEMPSVDNDGSKAKGSNWKDKKSNSRSALVKYTDDADEEERGWLQAHPILSALFVMLVVAGAVAVAFGVTYGRDDGSASAASMFYQSAETCASQYMNSGDFTACVLSLGHTDASEEATLASCISGCQSSNSTCR